MTPQHPLDLITRGVPSLQAWWDQYRAEDNYDPSLPRFHMSEFTLHMLDQAQGGVIPSFDKVAYGIEDALELADGAHWDAIGLSVIEVLLRDAEEHGLQLRSLYSSLGPHARDQWKDLYRQLNHGRQWPDAAALYLDSSPKCEQVRAGDSPSCLGSPRPLVSRGVARHRCSSKARTVDRGSQPASGKAGSRRAQSHGEGR